MVVMLRVEPVVQPQRAVVMVVTSIYQARTQAAVVVELLEYQATEDLVK